MNIYERYGRLQEQLDTEAEAHLETVNLLRRIKRGEVSLKQVAVTDDNRWKVQPPVELTPSRMMRPISTDGDGDRECSRAIDDPNVTPDKGA